MKKMFLVGALALFGAMNAQQGKGNFKVGAHLGFPVGDLGKASNFNLGIDVAFVYPIAENFKVGVTSGYSHYFSKSGNDNSGLGIIPVAATTQVNVASNVFVGADLGYAFFTNIEGITGAFYYQPKVGYSFSGKNDVYVSFKGMSREGGNANSINLGYAYNF